MSNLFAQAASLLLGNGPPQAPGPAQSEAISLLRELDYPIEDCPATRDRARLLQAASRFSRVFELTSHDAPGLFVFGAQFDPAIADPMHAGSSPAGASGVGLSLREAFQSCIGEGIEYASQLQTAEDVLVRSAPADSRAGSGRQAQQLIASFLERRLCPEAELSWCRARRLIDGREILLPADLCLRRPPAQQQVKPPFPLSTGSAAGASWDAAALHGVLELIERDAAGLWWRGGARGRAIPPSDEAQVVAQALLSQLRQNNSTRRSWLLDITTDIGVPCVAALSCRTDGFGLAFGLASRPTLAAAVRSAIREMCQIELAYEVVEAKCREGGEAALNEPDRVHRRRAREINADRCLLLQPSPEPARHFVIQATAAPNILGLIVERLDQFGVESFALDLTRPSFAVPVARIITAGLQPEPSEIVTPRLAAMIAKTGGGEIYTGGLALA
jgi:ribosomal protein S12 methylthiotransferase accessory factor